MGDSGDYFSISFDKTCFQVRDRTIRNGGWSITESTTEKITEDYSYMLQIFSEIAELPKGHQLPNIPMQEGESPKKRKRLTGRAADIYNTTYAHD